MIVHEKTKKNVKHNKKIIYNNFFSAKNINTHKTFPQSPYKFSLYLGRFLFFIIPF